MRRRWVSRSRAILLTLWLASAWLSVGLADAGATGAILPTISLTATSLGFGDQPVFWTSAAQTVQLTNTGTVSLILSSITINGDFQQTNTCLTTVAPTSSCSISVRFSPTAAGLRTGTVTITDNTAEGVHQIFLGGFGTSDSPVFTLGVASIGEGVLAITPPGTPFGPGSSTYAPGTVVTLRALPQSGYSFTGWTVNGVAAGWANPLTVTMNYHLNVVANFALTPAFADVPRDHATYTPITELAVRSAIRGYGNGRYGPDDFTLRAQIAALIARTMGWDGEDHGILFPDRGPVDDALWRNVNTVAFYNVARGFTDGTFHPLEAVTQAQAISLITRAMIARGAWQQQGDDPGIFPNVPVNSGHRQDLATFVHYAGGFPGASPNASWSTWGDPASRAWCAHVLWQALNSFWGQDTWP